MTRTKVLGISGALLVTGTIAATSIGLHGADDQKNVASASSPATQNAADLLAQRTSGGAVNRDLQRPSDPNSHDGSQKNDADKAAAQKAASDKAAADKAASDAKAAADKAVSDRAASDRAASDRAASDRAASDKAAAQKAASDKAAADKAASDTKAAHERAAADKAAAAKKADADRAAAAKRAAAKKAATPAYANNLDGWIKQAVSILHANGTNVSYNSVYQAAMHESAGNPSAVNGWDVNAVNGTPSIGLLQVIGPTFNAYKLPGHSNIYNPVDNIIAGARYAADRYGSLDNVVASRCGGSCWRGY